MLSIALFMSVLLPIQVHPSNQVISITHSLWMVGAAIDATKIVGIGNYRYKEKPVNLNPELFVREPAPDDKPIPKRKQFIQELVNQSTGLVMAH
jgi:hypothetical protein